MMKFLKRSRSSAGLAFRIAGINNIEIKNADVKAGKLLLREDSQIEFSIKKYIANSSLLAELRVETQFADISLTPQLFLNYGTGTGFSEIASLRLSPDGPNAWVGYVPVPHLLQRARLDLTETSATVVLQSIVVKRADISLILSDLLAKDTRILGHMTRTRIERAIDRLNEIAPKIVHGDERINHSLLAETVSIGLNHVSRHGPPQDDAYLAWIDRYERLTQSDRDWMNDKASGFAKQPLLSVLMPVYEPPLDLLEEAIACLQRQSYENWELCLADDASPSEAVRELIRKRASEDTRIKFVFRQENGHISKATNSAASLASGEFLILMDNDDLISDHALFTVAQYINDYPSARMLYSDEDKISLDGFRCEPYFKGKFDRFLLYGHNMFSHLGIYERRLFEEVGGFRQGYEGSQDYDLTLRCIERCADSEIVHIPHVLYHWRQIPGSTSIAAGEKSYAFVAAKRALNEHFQRMGYPLRSIDADVPGIASVRALSQPNPMPISIVIPTRDNLEVLEPCIASLLLHPDPLTEIVIVDNGSTQPETLEYLENLRSDANRVTIVQDSGEFNFSRLINLGVSKARGEIIWLLNNDTETLSANPYERARAWLSIPDVGIVGARLLYPDRTLQHYGVYVGVGPHGVAEHVHLGVPDAAHMHHSKSRLLQQFSAVTAASLFVRKRDFLAVGGFDEQLAVAYNDVDFCLKIREAGLKIICDPEIKLIHKESKSRGHDRTPAKKARLDIEGSTMRERWGKAGLQDPFLSHRYSTQNARFEHVAKPNQPLPWKHP